jgi:HK97 family phage major capsid protein
MEQETNTVTAPADNGLETKMDKILADVEAREMKAAETLKAAQDAQVKAEKALNEAVAAKNAHAVNFAPASKKDVKEETNKNFREFLGNVKAAKYGVKTALSASATTGSYLVPTDFLPNLFDFLVQYPAFVNDATRIPWGSVGSERHIPQLVSRPDVNATAEGAKKTLSNPAFGLIEQKLQKLTALVMWTRELTEDAAIYLPDYLPSIVGPQFTIKLNKWLFQGITNHPGIVNASGIVVPDSVDAINKVADLKWAVPYQYRANGKFYIETSLYGQLAQIARISAPSWLYYENGVMKIDGSDVVAVDPELIGNGIALFGDMKTVIFSPRNEIEVKYSDSATIVDTDGTTEHYLFQENKEAYLFELRADISVTGSVWAKADLSESGSESI